jgi:hypothetical protein
MASSSRKSLPFPAATFLAVLVGDLLNIIHGVNINHDFWGLLPSRYFSRNGDSMLVLVKLVLIWVKPQ